MAVETHWICDVCGKRVIETGETKNANETGIRDWYAVNLSVGMVKDPIGGPRVYKLGYACGDRCLEKVIEWLKEKSVKEIQKKREEKAEKEKK